MSTAAAKPRDEFRSIPIADIEPSPDNPRRITDDHPSLVGLAESIRETGLINPITVRDNPTAEGDDKPFQILAGERRWRAARKAGATEILCRVVDVTDEQAFHIITVENLQREDLHWLEEARGVEAMTKHGWDAATIAKHVGKSEQWVRLRAKLAGISPAWRKAVEKPGSDFHGWPASMLELIARLPTEAQEAMLGTGHGADYDLRRCSSVAELAKHMDRTYLRALHAAPWDLADPKLVAKAGACNACPKRTSCQQQLFAESKDDRCLDAACWTEKQHAHVVARVAVLKKEHPGALFSEGEYGAAGRDIPKPLAKTKTISSWQYSKTERGARGAIPVIHIAGANAGEVVFMKKDSDSPSGRASSAAPKAVTPAKRLSDFMKRRARAAIGVVIEKLGGRRDMTSVNHWGQPKACAADVTRPPRQMLMAFASAYGVAGLADFTDPDWKQVVRQREMTDDNLDASLWELVRRRLISRLIADKQFRGAADGARLVAAACGIHWNQITAAVRDAMPLPKSLAEHFDQDGRPMKALVPRKKPVAKPKPAKAKAAAAKS